MNTTSKMNTHPTQETLSAYIDAMLDVAQMHQTARHLQACEACRASCASLRETRDLLRHLPAPLAPPRDFWTNAYRQVRVGSLARSKRSWGEQVRHGLLGTQRRWAAGAAAATLLAGLLAAPLLSSEHHAPTHSGRIVAAMAPDVVDLTALVRDHTQSAAAQPLADSDRQAMLSADADDGFASGDMGAEAAGNGSSSSDAAP